MNPYSGNTFIEFFQTLFVRITHFLSFEKLSLASDELQICTLMLVAVSTALLGTFLVLRKETMLVNALSHTILVGIVGAYCISSLLYSEQALLEPEGVFFVGAALFMAFLTLFSTKWLASKVKLSQDAIIGAVFTCFFAIGIIFVTIFTRNSHIGTELLMGNSDALLFRDLKLNFFIVLGNVLLTFLLFRGYLITTFDADFSGTVGLKSDLFSYILMAQVSLTALAAFRAVGIMLVLSFFVLPPLIARQLKNSVSHMALLSCAISAGTVLFGVALSRHLLSFYDIAVSTSALIATLLSCVYILVLIKKSWPLAIVRK